MADKTGIEWTDATWNPIVGCSIVSPGCTNCYAMQQAHRLLDKEGSHYLGTTKAVNGNAVWTGKVAPAPQHIFDAPIRWKRPRKIFVNSMGDVFHENVPFEWIDRVFAVMALAPQHTFQLLTKRADRMEEYMLSRSKSIDFWESKAREIGYTLKFHDLALVRFPLPNVWLGVSVEDQKRADERIPHLLKTPAAIRFLSCEPLLGEVDLDCIPWPKGWQSPDDISDGIDALRFTRANGEKGHVDWVIAGGESGRDARPMHPAWAKSLRDQCKKSGVSFFFKQWGEWHGPIDPVAGGDLGGEMRRDHVRIVCADRENDGYFRKGDVMMRRVGKKDAGSVLSGSEWKEFPHGL